MKPVAHVERRKNTPNWGPLFIVGVLLLVTGPIVAPVFFNNPSSKIISMPSEAISASSLGASPKGQYAVEEMPLSTRSSSAILSPATKTTGPRFRLSGVVYSEAESYCLINGKVVKVGEEIGNARVEKISPDEVVLNSSGETIVLPVEA